MIDFLGVKRQKEQVVQNLLTGRAGGIADELSAARSKIEAGRNKALGGQFEGYLGSVGKGYNIPGLAGDTSAVRKRLGTSLNTNLASTGRQLNQQRIQATYDQALNMALDAGKNKQEAEAFAVQHMNDEISRQNQAWGTQFNINQASRIQDIEDQYAQAGVNLQNRYTPQTDYQSALMRILTGLPVQIGTAKLLNRSARKNPSQTTYNKTPISDFAGVGLENYGMNKSTSSGFAGTGGNF